MSCQRCCLHFLIPHPALFHDAFTGEIYYTKRYRVQEEFMELMMPHHEKTHSYETRRYKKCLDETNGFGILGYETYPGHRLKLLRLKCCHNSRF
jgi:hypothetical protein